MSLADRVVFQMDQATSTDKILLWNIGKCSKNPNMDCCFCIFIAIIKKRLNLEMSLYTFLQILSVTAFEKVSILQVLRDFISTKQQEDSPKQLVLFEL